MKEVYVQSLVVFLSKYTVISLENQTFLCCREEKLSFSIDSRRKSIKNDLIDYDAVYHIS